MMKQDIAKKLVQLRIKRHWTKSQVATYSGMSVDGIRILEHGYYDPRLSSLQKLCAVYGISLEKFFAEWSEV